MSFPDDSLDLSINKEKVWEVAGAPPNACPKCQQAFSKVLRNPNQLQKKAKLLIALGTVLSMVWAGMIYLYLSITAAQNGRPILIPVNKFTAPVLLVIVSLPGFAMSYWAMTFPKVTERKCKKCGWKKRYLVKGSTIVGTP